MLFSFRPQEHAVGIVHLMCVWSNSQCQTMTTWWAHTTIPVDCIISCLGSNGCVVHLIKQMQMNTCDYTCEDFSLISLILWRFSLSFINAVTCLKPTAKPGHCSNLKPLNQPNSLWMTGNHLMGLYKQMSTFKHAHTQISLTHNTHMHTHIFISFHTRSTSLERCIQTYSSWLIHRSLLQA